MMNSRRGSGLGIVVLLLVVALIGVSVYTGVLYFYADDGHAGVGIDTKRASEVSEQVTEDGRETLQKSLDEASDALRESKQPDN